MHYPFPDIIAMSAQDPTLMQRVHAVGRLDDSHMVVDLPADFDWCGLTPPAQSPMRGIGDLVSLFAQPIAQAIDGALGTDLSNCGGCAERQAALNKALPFTKGDNGSS